MREINNTEYKSVTGENGDTVLMRYNAKYKVWVKLHFSERDTGAAEHVMNVLGAQYVEEATQKVG